MAAATVRGNRAFFFGMAAVVVAVLLGVGTLVLTTPPIELRGRFLVLPGGWLRLLGMFVLLAGGSSLVAYLYGRATRPMRAFRYAVTSATHLFILLVVVAVFYPVVYLLAVSFNRNDTLAGALPRAGNVLVRAGVFPDPARLSLTQYGKVLDQTHLLPFQWGLLGLMAILVVVLIGNRWLGGNRTASSERLRRGIGWTMASALAVLIASISPGQFFEVAESGQRIPASIGGMVPLYIRNTLLVSGTTGLFAVLLSTTAGYAFSRMRFEGRYPTLLTFVFAQMFPTFMALVAIFYLMSYLDLINTFPGLILAYSGGAIAFASWIFKGYLDSISPSLEEAAMVDGATRWGAFWRIILPVSVPMLLFIFLLQFIGTYSEFILANTILIGQEHWTVGVGLRNFTTNQFSTQWGAMAAAAVLGSIPILVIFYSFQDALTGQYQSGGVKG